MSKKTTLSRRIVLEILENTQGSGEKLGVFLRSVLNKYDYIDPRDKAFIKYLTEGVVSYQIKLDYVIGQFAKVKGKMKPLIRHILRMGIFQIMYMDSVPDEAACNESVNLAVDRGMGQLRGFVNGVLRNVSRNKDKIKWPGDMSVIYSCPKWICDMIVKEYGKEKADTILASTLKPAPINIRLRENLDNKTKEEVINAIKEAGHNPVKHPYLPYAYTLENVPGMENVPGFMEGYITVQDVSSQLLVECAGIKEGDHIIDMCAAPGGKSIHAADKCGSSGHVEARDLTEFKTDLIEENIERMQVTNTSVKVWDGTVEDNKAIESADIVICDLPCSGIGVIGRKNDIKYNISPESVKELASLQRAILDNAVKYLKKGGILMYSTCTITKSENIDNRKYIIEEKGLKPVSIEDSIAKALIEDAPEAAATIKEGYLQLLPGLHRCDGFFISKYIKQ